jgi:hypothetical protein
MSEEAATKDPQIIDATPGDDGQADLVIAQPRALAEQLSIIIDSKNPFRTKQIGPRPGAPVTIELLHAQGYYDVLRKVINDASTTLKGLASDLESNKPPSETTVRGALAQEYDKLKRCARAYFGTPMVAEMVSTRYCKLATQFSDLATNLELLSPKKKITAEDLLQIVEQTTQSAASKNQIDQPAQLPLIATNPTVAMSL